MEKQKIESFGILGIAVRTTNENGQSGKDIPALWNKFMSEGVLQKIPGKTDDTLYCVYTDYEKDHTKPYTTVLGCKVNPPVAVPEGMVYKVIPEGNYNRHTANGNILQGMVFQAWQKIWDSETDRKFTADFEVYGEKASDPKNAEVAIFVAVK